MTRHISTLSAAIAAAGLILSGCSSEPEIIVTTQDSQWQAAPAAEAPADARQETLSIDLNAKGQTIQGFGTAFSELSYDALSALSEQDRNDIMKELFTPGYGASFSICRTPLGASDFARSFYSYNETDGDFAMENFSIERDKTGLLPLIKSALANNPSLKIWASPWCPPTWLKNNKHYASAPMNPMTFASMAGINIREMMKDKDMRTVMNELRNMDFSAILGPGVVTNNGITDAQLRAEGTESFTLEEDYLKAYALYFQKYIKAYREEGVDIFMVMPQNEPNSNQNFPSCTWTPKALAQFERYLGPAMEEVGVDLYHGTMERADYHQAETCIEDEVAGKYIKGVAFQWAGKDALPEIHKRYPNLTMVMSEHQCFNGANSWKDLMDSWDLMRHYLSNGVAIYDYWNLALKKSGVSTWGWKQNSLVLVDEQQKTYKFNYEFYLMKHFSHYVTPGSVFLGTAGTFGEALAFQRPDGKIVIVAAEKTGKAVALNIEVGKKKVSATLQPDSITTILI